jgi:hypothetical protein
MQGCKAWTDEYVQAVAEQGIRRPWCPRRGHPGFARIKQAGLKRGEEFKGGTRQGRGWQRQANRKKGQARHRVENRRQSNLCKRYANVTPV